MKKQKIRTFQGRLREDLKDSEFKMHYKDKQRALVLAMKIAKLREKRGLTQAEFAKKLGTSQQAVSRIESGEYEGFTLKTLEKIAEATGTRLKIDFVAA
jgi:DNA-binding XRE family transcriptional regulator